MVSLDLFYPVPYFAKPAKNSLIRPHRTREGEFLSPAFSFCTSVELTLSLRTRLARQMHARRMHNL